MLSKRQDSDSRSPASRIERGGDTMRKYPYPESLGQAQKPLHDAREERKTEVIDDFFSNQEYL
jgi:hypothetical protein